MIKTRHDSIQPILTGHQKTEKYLENLLVPYHSVAEIPCTRALVFAPHPDDEVFGCGGAIMRHVEHGAAVHVIIVTDGGYDIGDDQIDEYILQRRNESIAAAEILGYGTPRFWNYPDRHIRYDEKLIQEVLATIRETGADLIYAPSVFEIHPDHRMLAMAVIEATRRVGSNIRIALYEIGMPLRPNLLLDISDVVSRKTTAMECFISQNTRQRYDLHITALNQYRTYTLPAEIKAAEAYIIISAEEIVNDPLKLYQSEHARQKSLGVPLEGQDLPLVSVMIRSMDRTMLSDALDSVALQTYPNIEVVLINAKGVGHREIGQWCGRFPLRMFSSGRPLKRSHAANCGLDLARGEYCIFLDDDDLFDPDHIANLIESLKSAWNCSAAYAGVRVENEKGIISGVFNQSFSAVRLMAGNFIPIHAVLFKRILVEQGCRFDENLDSYEDWDFWLQVARKTDFVHAKKVSAVYRAQLGNSGMSQSSAHNVPLQRLFRLQVWEKWWRRWTMEDFDHLVADFHQQLADKEQLLDEHAERITILDQAVSDCDTQVTQLRCSIAEKEAKLNSLRTVLTEVYGSHSWRSTALLRWAGHHGRQTKAVLFFLLRYGRQNGWKNTYQKIFDILRYKGLAGAKLYLQSMQAQPQTGHHAGTGPYLNTSITWNAESKSYSLTDLNNGYTYIPPRRPDNFDDILLKLNQQPKFSIIVPIFNTPPDLLRELVSSVLGQWYSKWQLTLVDDGSSSVETLQVLKQLKDVRIVCEYLEKNSGISHATNVAISRAKGDYVVFLDHDDTLTEDCLYELARCIDQNDPDFIYSDEDKIDTKGRFVEPHFKPDWSPDTMMSTMYTCHVCCIRISLLQELGGLRSEYDGCQDWDLVLRLSERTNRIHHIPKVLYHWRIIPDSVASGLSAKPYVLEASQRIRRDALARRGQMGKLEPVEGVPGYFRMHYDLMGTPLISIIIPSRDNRKILNVCLDSIINRSSYTNYEIIVIDNGSVEPGTADYMRGLPQMDSRIKYLHHDAPFNFSELNNIGVKHSAGEILLFLNDDTEISSSDWLERMGGYSQLPHIGAVGAKLLYPNGKTIQHTGIVNLRDGPGHAFIHRPKDTPGYFMRNLLEYNWLAVTGACLMIRRELFLAMDGFDESFPIAYNDVELCIRMVKSGSYNVVVQSVQLIHHESASRGLDHADAQKYARLMKEKRRLYRLHPDFFERDPFHNPNLHPNGANFELAVDG